MDSRYATELPADKSSWQEFYDELERENLLRFDEIRYLLRPAGLFSRGESHAKISTYQRSFIEMKLLRELRTASKEQTFTLEELATIHNAVMHYAQGDQRFVDLNTKIRVQLRNAHKLQSREGVSG